MLDVVEIIMKLVGRGFDLRDIALIDLRPAGNARPHNMAIIIKGDRLLIGGSQRK